MAQSPYFKKRNKEIYKDYQRLLGKFFNPGKKLKKQIKARIARKYGLSKERIVSILREVSNE